MRKDIYTEAVEDTLRVIEEYADLVAVPIDSEDDAERADCERRANAIRCAVTHARQRRALFLKRQGAK